MSDVVNLNRFRKKKARTEKEKRGEENRIRFGRTKAENSRYKRDAEKLAKHLDGHERQDDQ